jgi:serine/threonine protein kinase
MGEVIGKGAAAEVHKAVNEETGQTVAIKKMRKVGMKTEQAAAVAVRPFLKFPATPAFPRRSDDADLASRAARD